MHFFLLKGLKGTVHRYRSHAIMHYFTDSEIITELKVCVIYGTCVKIACNIHGQVESSDAMIIVIDDIL